MSRAQERLVKAAAEDAAEGGVAWRTRMEAWLDAKHGK